MNLKFLDFPGNAEQIVVFFTGPEMPVHLNNEVVEVLHGETRPPGLHRFTVTVPKLVHLIAVMSPAGLHFATK